ncbi:DUF6138 family protein [Paenibacillus wynnii]|uniref:Uncharacterized protein n=1 Tax=Paenibacillus wynnii TaxID=268407 RepID=A0A098MET6_9BACL|nr:DUF6138 family protein [Paenibacillus wynnii]KGE21044.1 hypothetical protein PWYN_02490 [Paenibacillus wynnii]
MNKAAESILNEIWTQLLMIYKKEKERIDSLKGLSPLHSGIMDYVRVSFIKSTSYSTTDQIALDIYIPLSFSDDSYKVDADPNMEELSDDILINEFYPALRARMDQIFTSDEYSEHFFGYQLQLVLECKRETSSLLHQEYLRNEVKLDKLKQQLSRFIETKVWKDLPVLPSDKDEFFFSRHLMNPDLMEQDPAVIEPLIHRLNEKLITNHKHREKWLYTYVSAFKEWAEEQFLDQYFERTGNFGIERTLLPDDKRPALQPREMDFFLYTALHIGQIEPVTRKLYLELAVQLDSEQASAYLTKGSGHFEAGHAGSLMSGKANDIMQSIEIRINSEEEAAYREALEYICDLLRQGFPKAYQLKLKSTEKHWLPVKTLAKSNLHQFFANSLQYEALFPLLAEYAELAMKEFAWYGDVESGIKSVMPGTYAVFGLGLVSDTYFPLVRRYMELVDSEHQSAQDGYAEAFVESHGLNAGGMHTFVSILLGGNDLAKPVKGIAINTAELADALILALEDKADHQRDFINYRIFGSEKKLIAVLKQAESPLKERLEVLMKKSGTQITR